ncbi:MAG TPA: hemerythrin family protein [Candidatus Limnocylindrales bacterium]|jgi:hemerythrin|nr:hemerythrin family protein [Candidatus Limnocylindrales bacterium]
MSEQAGALPVRVGEQSIDAEHDLQMQLLDSLAQAIQRGGELSPMKYILEQFIEFSDMHFLSEQLVMRLHGYPGYEPHLEEHTRLMKKVREVRSNLLQGENAPSLVLVQELREWLVTHIAQEDAAFGIYLKKQGASA